MPENLIQKQYRDKRNREIAKLYPQKTYQELSQEFDLTPQQIQKIIKKVVGKIKK